MGINALAISPDAKRTVSLIAILTIACFLIATHARAPTGNNYRISIAKFPPIFAVGVAPGVVLDHVVHRCAGSILVYVHDLGVVSGVGGMLPVQRLQTGVEA